MELVPLIPAFGQFVKPQRHYEMRDGDCERAGCTLSEDQTQNAENWDDDEHEDGCGCD